MPFHGLADVPVDGTTNEGAEIDTGPVRSPSSLHLRLTSVSVRGRRGGRHDRQTASSSRRGPRGAGGVDPVGRLQGEALRSVEAVQVLARSERVLLDPVYTGKTGAGLIGLARRRFFAPGERVLFLPTGGLPSRFACGDMVLGDTPVP